MRFLTGMLDSPQLHIKCLHVLCFATVLVEANTWLWLLLRNAILRAFSTLCKGWLSIPMPHREWILLSRLLYYSGITWWHWHHCIWMHRLEILTVWILLVTGMFLLSLGARWHLVCQWVALLRRFGRGFLSSLRRCVGLSKVSEQDFGLKAIIRLMQVPHHSLFLKRGLLLRIGVYARLPLILC